MSSIKEVFKPLHGYKPEHSNVSSWIFEIKEYETESAAAEEANLADAVARVASRHNMNKGEIMAAFPIILRILKSHSPWAGYQG